ncbi:MAG TPA: S8 family peptidase [Paludibacteraceae bacterium]|nr:S8 family peptidase [Paludibacteraceae bacterium]
MFCQGHSQETNYFFYVQLSDKKNSPFSLEEPLEYLSERAIERRKFFSIPLDSTDLPINPSYLNLIQQTGAKIHCCSKWLNGLTVLLQDSNLMANIRSLPFVKWTQYTGKTTSPSAKISKKTKFKVPAEQNDYANQIKQVGGDYLLKNGLRGKNIHIGVLDAGFTHVNINPAFDSLRLQNRLLGTKDIVSLSDLDIFEAHFHGANVLSIMTANLPEQYIGSAPGASYWLIRTENDSSEYLVEIDFWVAGIEYADSVGVDLVNSSLSYTIFDESSMDFQYEDMNGENSRASRAATIAAQKGIIVVVSAGNEGNKTWKYIGSPADAKETITVGGVRADGNPSAFSSFGPTFDGRVKPEICARGTSVEMIDVNGNLTYGNGTSYAAPIITGLMAGYLQYFKENQIHITIHEILQSIFRTGNLYFNPTDQMGYGIPNFQAALENYLTKNEMIIANNVQWFINKSDETIHIQLPKEIVGEKVQVRVYSDMGILRHQQEISSEEIIISTSSFLPGIYLIHIRYDNKLVMKKIII